MSEVKESSGWRDNRVQSREFSELGSVGRDPDMDGGMQGVSFMCCGLVVLIILFVLPGLALTVIMRSTEAHNTSVRSVPLWQALRGKGYAWITLSDAAFLYNTLGEDAFNVPSREELRQVPGYRDGYVQFIVDVMRKETRE